MSISQGVYLLSMVPYSLKDAFINQMGCPPWEQHDLKPRYVDLRKSYYAEDVPVDERLPQEHAYIEILRQISDEGYFAGISFINI